MTEDPREPQHTPPERPVNYAHQLPQAAIEPPSVLMTVVSAGLFLYVGFGLGLSGISGNAIYDGSVTVFVWGARIVGVGLLAVAGLELTRQPGAALLDVVLGAIATALCFGVAAVWLAFGDFDILVTLFGVLNANATLWSWKRWRALRQLAG